jgi:Na(+)-translocating NADH:ubiquinone oxidoreductase B subunit
VPQVVGPRRVGTAALLVWNIEGIPLIVVSYGVGLGIEFFTAQIRGHEINEGFLVSGMLIPLIVPIDTPLWMLAIATAFAVIIGKEVFGGTGMNILNPALTARAFLFFSYPAWMSGDKVWVEGVIGNQCGRRLLRRHTPGTGSCSHETGSLPSVMEMFIGTIPGSVGETSTLAILIGAVILIATGIGSWKIIVSVTVPADLEWVADECSCSQSVYGDACLLPSDYGWICLWSSLYGNRPGYSRPDREGKMDLRILIGVLAVLSGY